MDTNDKVVRLYSRLISLKNNLPKDEMYGVHEKYVSEYHSIVRGLEEVTTTDLSEFMIPDNEVRNRESTGNYVTGETQYTSEKWCDKEFFITKLDGLLGYFQIKHLSKEKPEVGFKIPSE